MNFYKYVYDTKIFNQKAQINYIVGYIYLIKLINIISNMH